MIEAEKIAINEALKSFTRIAQKRYDAPVTLSMDTVKSWHKGYGYTKGHSYERIYEVLLQWQAKGWASIKTVPSEQIPVDTIIAEITVQC